MIHAHWAIPTGPAAVHAARRAGIPSVITMHGGDVYVNPEQGYDFPTRWYVRPALRWTLRHAGALTAITDDCRQHALRAGAPPESIHLVFNGTDLRRFSPAPGGHERVDPKFGPNMIFACRQLFPRKGIRFLIEAAAQLKPRFPDLKVVVAGDGFERPELVQLAQTLGIADDVTFLGWVANTELPPYYRAAAVSVIPSLEEGFGIPAAEAMGCETPVVASDAGGLPEVVEHGVTGLIVPRGDSSALAEAIGSLLADPERRTRDGSRGPRARAPAVRLGPVGRAVRAHLCRRPGEGQPVTDRLFDFRWDVDHRVCITDGLPRIRAVCRDFGVPNTFFVNLGRSTNLREWLGKGVTRSKAKLADRDAVHLIKKTGWPRFLVETALSRPVGLSLVSDIHALQAEGHELGLHGGMDHVVWSRRFHELPDADLVADVEESYGHFVRHFGQAGRLLVARLLFRRAGHAAARPARLPLQRRRDRGRAAARDRRGPHAQPLDHSRHPLRAAHDSVPRVSRRSRNAGGGGHAACWTSTSTDHDSVILYGHPCYEGVREGVLRKVFARVVEHGFRFVTMQTMAERLQAAPVPR